MRATFALLSLWMIFATLVGCPSTHAPSGEGEAPPTEGEGEPALRGFGGRCDDGAQCESERCFDGFCTIYCNPFTSCPDGYSCHVSAEACIARECSPEDRCSNGEVCRRQGTCAFSCERPRGVGETCIVDVDGACFPDDWPCEPGFECARSPSNVEGTCVIPAGEGERCVAANAAGDVDGCLDGLSCVPLEETEPLLAFCRNL